MRLHDVRTASLLTVALIASASSSALAQPQPMPQQQAPASTAAASSTDIKGIRWTALETLPLASAPGKDGMMGIAELQPGAPAELHSHAENEVGYVLAGESELEVDGERPRIIRAGDSFAIPAGRNHRAKPTGSTPLKVLVYYIVERGQPLARPAK